MPIAADVRQAQHIDAGSGHYGTQVGDDLQISHSPPAQAQQNNLWLQAPGSGESARSTTHRADDNQLVVALFPQHCCGQSSEDAMVIKEQYRDATHQHLPPCKRL
jgi:hypothetical protein